MQVITILCLALLLFLFVAQPNTAVAEEPQRPRIGLVLGGGGAAGVAHVGVLKVLEEHGVPIDYVAGTSMGAIVGGLYASGMNAKELETVVGQLDWISLFDDEPERALRSYRSKSDRAEFVGSFEVGFDKKGVNVERGAVLGQRLTFELRRILEHTSHIRDFDHLAIPFRAVATDIENGKEVILKEGNLATALRASMSIPGLFPPVSLNGKLLVDGFVSNNVPTHVVRDMGADILIVVNIPTELKKQDELDSALSISLQTMKLLMAFTSQHVNKLTAPDLVIEPDMQEIGPLNFDRVGETIEIGFKAAREHDKALKALVERVGKRTIQTNTPRKAEHKKINRILVENNSVLDDRLIVEKLGLQEGDTLDFEKLQEGLARVYGLGYFETVDYRLKTEGDNSILTINAQADPTGNNRLRLGFTLEDDFEGDALYRIGTSFIKRGLFASNGELKVDLVVGSTFALVGEWYQPLRSNSKWFAHPKLWTTKNNIHQYQENQRLREFRVSEIGAEFEMGRVLDTWGRLSGGVLYKEATPKVRVGDTPQNLDQIKSSALTARFNVDTLDNPRFPSSGHAFNTEILYASKDFSSDNDYTRVEVEGLKAWTHNKHHWIATAAYGSSLDDNLPLNERFSLGGFTRLSGLNRDQINGQHYALFSGVYLYELGNFYDMARLFVGTSLEVGNTWENRDDIGWKNTIVSGSGFVSADTPLGPLSLGFGKTERQETSAFLYLGFPFR